MYRILAAEQPVRERRNQLAHPRYTKPELVATAPNQTSSCYSLVSNAPSPLMTSLQPGFILSSQAHTFSTSSSRA